MLKAKIETKGLKQIKTCFPRALETAKKHAISAVVTTARAEWARLIAKDINLPIDTIKSAIHFQTKDNGAIVTTDSKSSRYLGTANSPTRALPVFLFQPVQKPKGVSVKIKKQRVLIAHSFFATLGSQRNVFKRKTKKRFPIYVVRTTALEQVALDNIGQVQKTIQTKLPDLLQQKLTYQMSLCR